MQLLKRNQFTILALAMAWFENMEFLLEVREGRFYMTDTNPDTFEISVVEVYTRAKSYFDNMLSQVETRRAAFFAAITYAAQHISETTGCHTYDTGKQDKFHLFITIPTEGGSRDIEVSEAQIWGDAYLFLKSIESELFSKQPTIEQKSAAIEAAIIQIKEDLTSEDFTALFELLSNIPLDKLQGYLPE